MNRENKKQFHLGVNTLFFIPGQVGGAETFLRETLRELLPILPGPCTIFTNLENDRLLRQDLERVPHSGKLEFDCLGFQAVNRYQRIIREQFQLSRHVRRAHCNILWSPGYTACLMTRIPQLVSIFDMQYRRFPQDLSFIGRWTTHFLITVGVRHCQRVSTLSEFSKNEIVHFTKMSPGKIDVPFAGVSTRFSDQVIRDPSRTPYLLCVAGSYPHKNLPSLILAFDKIASKIPHHLILVGGKGLGEEKLEKTIDGAIHRDRIERKRGISREELLALYQQADLFVLPSLYEGFGLPVLEAQLAGIPVLTTGRASIAEVGGKSLFLYDPDQEGALEKGILKTLSVSSEERARRIEEGRENARQFTWRRTAELTLASLRNAVKEKGRRS